MTECDFTITGHGTNKEGNHWCTRDYGSSGTGHHYSNKDGSFYYKNPDGSQYFNNGSGKAALTTPNSHVVDLQK
ncbi:hypothetical protein DEU56DRAFT_985106 [Suillus clintonianus]|uniref:uncharacterized protein n=1 Tax=Suillus clintonianus TaxID=1904413 RepID=UPI001B86F253|nr:uncharacterized protein DEU56DRAFT_985106 [Suillus clintonianus]KAG2114853.1 hypothetical protein DEU56DRAFT_985106 [Suillus clintonianus]